jgi:hypothetical protein
MKIKPIEWARLSEVDETVIAASPMVRGGSEVPHRIAIRDLGDQYVVHTQIFDGVRKPYFHQGDYFPKTNDSAPVAHPPAEALCKAWARFEERARRTMQLALPPTKKLIEVANIADSIIETLLPDDEDERRELVTDDYQLESDIQTFEQLTGKELYARETP